MSHSVKFRWTSVLLLAGFLLVLQSDGSKASQSRQEPAMAPPNCDTKEKNTELNETLGALKTCLGDQPNQQVPLNCQKLQEVVTCLNDFFVKVDGCYNDSIDIWKKVVQGIEQLHLQLCDRSQELADLYRKGGVECLNKAEVRACGVTFNTILLNPSDYNDIARHLMGFDPSNCRNFTEINNCVVDKLRDTNICPNPAVANVTDQVNAIIGKHVDCPIGKGGAKELLVNSTLVWIIAISISSLVLLSPSTLQ